VSRVLGFLTTTVLGGVFFLFPVVVLTVILAKAFQLMMVVAEPLDGVIPTDEIGGFALVNLLALLAILLTCFLAGLAAKSAIGRAIVRAIDDRMLIVVPFYASLKGKLTGNIGSDADETNLKPIVARLDDYSQLAFEIERLDSGDVIVFLPGSPDPWSGAAVVMTPDRVEPMDLDHMDVANTLRALGRGTRIALAARQQRAGLAD